MSDYVDSDSLVSYHLLLRGLNIFLEVADQFRQTPLLGNLSQSLGEVKGFSD